MPAAPNLDDPDSCANPILARFLKQWWERAHDNKTKDAPSLKRAYTSLLICPLLFQHPSETALLDGIGPTIAARLTTAHADHCTQHGLPPPRRRPAAAAKRAYNAAGRVPSPVVRKPAPRAPYLPQRRSGAYALLLALLDADRRGESPDKRLLVEAAQPDCDASFEAPRHVGGFHTAWSAMKTLKGKGLVYAQGRPERFLLSAEGRETAEAVERARDGDAGGGEAVETARDAEAGEVSMGDGLGLDVEPVGGSRGVVDCDSVHGTGRRMIPGASSLLEEMGFGPPSPPPRRPEPEIYDLSSPPRKRPAEHNRDLDDEERRRIRIQRETLLGSVSKDQRPIDRPSLPSRSTTGLSSRPLSASSSAGPVPTHIPTAHPAPPPTTLAANTFTITLLLDTREIRTTTDRDYLSTTLSTLGTPPLTRSLTLGDALWIARETPPPHREVVLSHIAERKRLDDLLASLHDGRYHEQKHRLHRSGLSHVLYVIEDTPLRGTHGTPRAQAAVEGAIASTMLADGFFVKRTSDVDASMRYLARVTRRLQEEYRGREVVGSEYTAFQEMGRKSAALQLRDVFLKMLVCQLGMGVEKARAVQRRWRTPGELVKVLAEAGERGWEAVLVEEGAAGRGRIPRGLAKRVGSVWGGA